MVLGEALRLIRVFHDKKLTQLANELGVSPGFLSEVERGKSGKKPSLDLIQKYAEVFNTKPSVILFFSEELDSKETKGKIKLAARDKILKFLKAMDRALD